MTTCAENAVAAAARPPLRSSAAIASPSERLALQPKFSTWYPFTIFSLSTRLIVTNDRFGYRTGKKVQTVYNSRSVYQIGIWLPQRRFGF